MAPLKFHERMVLYLVGALAGFLIASVFFALIELLGGPPAP